MKKIISLLTVLALTAALLSFAACKKNQNTAETDDTSSTQEYTKKTTEKPVEIADIPESTKDRVEMLNSALDYIDIYCHQYTKHIKCDVSSLNIGGLSAASNAADAFRSIFGKTDITNEYDYDSAPESFANNFIKERFSDTDVLSADAKQEDGNIVLKITFPDESNPGDSKGQLHKLSTEYISVSKLNSSLGEFDSSAGSVSISATGIIATATISAADSSLKKLVVEYTESFALSSVKLVQLEGSSVTGTAKTVETYSEIKN